jgi:hypothetical protein
MLAATPAFAQVTPHQLLGSVVMLIVTADECKLDRPGETFAALASAGEKPQRLTGLPEEQLRQLAAEVAQDVQGVDCALVHSLFDGVGADTLSKIEQLPQRAQRTT